MAEHQLPTHALHEWIVELWRCAGSSEHEARLIADHLIGANLAGHDSHGIGMVPRYVKSYLNGEMQLNRTARIVHDQGSLITVDGQHGVGQSVAEQAMDLAIERAREHGVCVMGLRNAHHIGRVGHWAEQAVDAGFVSIHFTNVCSQPLAVAPFGGAEARFTTNPFTVGIPIEGRPPILLDFATSAVAMGKVRVAFNKKVRVPPASLIDSEGRDSEDPAVMYAPPSGHRGALQTAAAHKGYALAVVCELLAAALTGGPTATPGHFQKVRHGIWNNMLAIVFDPARMGTGAGFDTAAREFIDWVKSARLREGFDEILMPGDPERRSAAARSQQFPIDSATLAELDESAAAIGSRFGHGLSSASSLIGADSARS